MGERKRRKGTKKKYGGRLTDALNCLNLVLDFSSLDHFVCRFNLEKEEGEKEVQQGEERPAGFCGKQTHILKVVFPLVYPTAIESPTLSLMNPALIVFWSSVPHLLPPPPHRVLIPPAALLQNPTTRLALWIIVVPLNLPTAAVHLQVLTCLGLCSG